MHKPQAISTMALLRATLLLLLLPLASMANSSAGEAHEWSLLEALDDSGLGLSLSLDDHEAMQACDPLLGECTGDDEDADAGGERDMASEIMKRVLRAVSRRFISYGALNKNRVPCNRRGQSYYNCRPRARANPYRRGCSVITRCARVVH